MECTLEMENMRGKAAQDASVTQGAAKSQAEAEQRKQTLIEAYKAAYVEAVKAGYSDDDAKNYARQNMAGILSQMKQGQE